MTKFEMGINILRVCLIIANAICVAMTDSEVAKICGVVVITFMSISFLERQDMGNDDNTD